MRSIITSVLFTFFCVSASAQTFTTTFSSDMEGWTAGFSDYPMGAELFYELLSAHAPLPSPLDPTDKAAMISGNNHSDDLFMYLKKRISGLQPNTAYLVRFDVQFASNASTTSYGVGGPPGGAVTVKCGASIVEPVSVVNSEQYYQMNIDKSNQSQGGADMDTIGNVGVCDTTTVYALTTRSNASHPFSVTTDGNGAVWVIVGTDSGFEATTTLYYNNIVVTFSYPTPVELSPLAPSFEAELLPLYPNPIRSTGVATVRLPRSEIVSLTVYDAAGRLLLPVLRGEALDAGTHAFSIPIATLPDGCFFVRMVTGTNTVLRRVHVAKR